MFEVEFLSAIDVVGAAPFGEMYCIFDCLSKLAPLSLASSAFEPCEHQDIHLNTTFGLVCKACYVYHPYSDLWLVPMRRILGLMFNVVAPFLYYSVDALDREFGYAFCWHSPQFDCP